MYRRTRVYIAGPYTKGGVEANVGRAMDAWCMLWISGYAPFCPHWSHFQHERSPLPYGDWIAFDLGWLRCCDALLRLPGESKGADEEWRAARLLGLPTFTSVAELVAAVAPEREV